MVCSTPQKLLLSRSNFRRILRTAGIIVGWAIALQFTAHAQITASPTSLSWYTVAIGNAGGPKSATLTNTGTSAIGIISIGFTGANPGDFTIYQKTCGSTLAASASCSVTVLFKPTTSGTRTAALTFTDSASNSPQHVSLSGLGTGGTPPPATGTASPTSLSWTNVTLGSSGGPQSATLTNTGSSAISITSISFSGANPGDFTIYQKTCGSTLAASASCTVTVVFKPTTSGTRTAILTFTDNASNSPQQVSLSGLGGTPPPATGTASPTSLSWTNVTLGSAGGPQSATLTNTGGSAISITGIGFTGANTGDFTINQNTCGSTLAASASCTVTVVFKPTSSGTRTAILTFTDNASNSPQQVSLSGLGGTPPPATGTASPTSLSWTNVTLGSAGGPQSATLTNTGGSAISITGIGFTGANTGDFTINQNTCGSTLAASASCTVTVVFKPTTSGTRTAALTFTDNASNSPQQVSLSGLGGAPSPVTGTTSPTSLSWYTVAIGNAGGPKSATLTNTGSSAMGITSMGFTGANPDDFTIYQKTCGSTLAASASCTVTVLFKPTNSGTRTASLTFTDNASNSPQQVSLSGLGTGDPTGNVTAIPASLSFGSVTDGSTSASQTITVSNTTSSPVTLSTPPISGANASAFGLSSTTCGSSLAASASCTAAVAFAPAAAGSYAAAWNITSSFSPTPLSVALSGAGIDASNGVSPATATVSEGATQQFTASGTPTWTASCGSISASGLYTAPLTPGTCTVTATPTSSGNAASAIVTVTSPIALTPALVNLHALNTQQFTASAPVNWTASCGSISTSGLFTAPTTPGGCTLTATASTGTPFTAIAPINVDIVNYTAWKGGGGNTGAQTDELLLTPSNVDSSSFGIVWQANVDGWVNAQPLYMNGLMINGAPHNVVFIATANDSVYAFDGDTGSQLWQVSLIPSGATAVNSSSVGFTSDQPQIGILSTPVIDPSTNTMYVVSETSEQNATSFPHRLHALDITTGQEKFGGPVLISNPQMAPVYKLQRPGLLLANGSVYVGIGSLNDTKPYNGMLFAFNAATLAQQSVWVTTPTGSEGGIWMGGAAPSVDENGDIYVATGNGTFDGITNYGEAAVKLGPGLQLLDYFAPYNYATYDASDIDVGSGDVMIVPDQSGPYQHELIVCGKPTPIYLLDRDNMGQVGTTSDNIIQELNGVVGQLGTGKTLYACYTTPAMWGQNVYFGGKYDVLKMFTLNASTGLLSTSPVSQGALAYGYPGADPVVSANGNTNGIVWTIDTGTSTLRANDATNVANLLYSGPIAEGAIRWTIPTVVNGHVYVAEEGIVYAFGVN